MFLLITYYLFVIFNKSTIRSLFNDAGEKYNITNEIPIIVSINLSIHDRIQNKN